MLKPQDLFVALKLIALGPSRPSYSWLGGVLVMSPSEVHACVKRATICHLLHGEKLNHRPNLSAIEEFLIHGVRYVFPAERGPMTRGIPTSYARPQFTDLISRGDEPIPIWPYEGGSVIGVRFEPLYRSAPAAALTDEVFYRYLTLVDVLRDQGVRERKLAQVELQELLRGTRDRQQS